jgi:peptide deformylase
MSVKPILRLGNPALRKKSVPVKAVHSTAIKAAVTDLSDTLNDFRSQNGFGRGIAAPQIGVLQRIVFINVEKPIALLNPRITKRSKRMFSLWDDCFSFPDLAVKVRRHHSIRVSYVNRHGEKAYLDASGELSELLQHEIDHLDGILAVDRAISLKHIILKSELPKIKQR